MLTLRGVEQSGRFNFSVPAAAPSELLCQHTVPVPSILYGCTRSVAMPAAGANIGVGSAGRQGLCELASPCAPLSHGIRRHAF